MLLSKEEREYYLSLKLGDIVHVDHGFHEFIRCKIVEQHGERRLKPIALVGLWKPEKLPHYSPEGEIEWGYAGLVKRGDTMLSHTIFVYESKGYAYHDPDYPDPKTLTPIAINTPRQTKKQQEDAVFYRAIRDVCEILAPNRLASTSEPPRILLEKAQKVIDGVLTAPKRAVRINRKGK